MKLVVVACFIVIILVNVSFAYKPCLDPIGSNFNGFLNRRKNSRNTYTYTLECCQGYMVEGDSNVICNHENGNWVIRGRCVPFSMPIASNARCGPLIMTVDNGFITAGCSKHMDFRYIGCNPGFTLMGPPTTSCNTSKLAFNNGWSPIGGCNRDQSLTTQASSAPNTPNVVRITANPPTLPTTKPLSCGNVPKLDKGHYTGSASENNQGSVRRIICPSGYFLDPDQASLIVCLPDGQWSPPGRCISSAEYYGYGYDHDDPHSTVGMPETTTSKWAHYYEIYEYELFETSTATAVRSTTTEFDYSYYLDYLQDK